MDTHQSLEDVINDVDNACNEDYHTKGFFFLQRSPKHQNEFINAMKARVRVSKLERVMEAKRPRNPSLNVC